MFRLNTYRLIARVWKLPLLAASIVVCWLLWGVLDTPIAVPGRSSVAEDVWPLIPAVFAIAVVESASIQHTPLERAASRSIAARRFAQVGISVFLLGVLLTAEPGAADRMVVSRNALLLVGAGYLLLAVAGKPAALLLLALGPSFMWILGSHGAGMPPAPWAVLLYQENVSLRWLAVGIMIVGALVYVSVRTPLLTNGAGR